jgi:glyoxylase-like metal-dependent hydrolase (beta-lactamase superfamily II)
MIRPLLLFLLFAGGAANAGPASADAFRRFRKQIAEGVWLVYRPVATDAPFEGNTVVFEQSGGLVVVDAGGSPLAGGQIVEQIRAISPKPVKFLVYTHYHGDHNLGAGALLEAWPALAIISTERTRTHMTGRPMAYIASYDKSYAGMVEFGRKRMEDPNLGASEQAGWRRFVEAGPSMLAGYANLRAYPATLTFNERLNLPDASMPLELLYLGRANTDGDLVVWAPQPKVLATGDIVAHPVPYASACYPGEWQAVLGRIKAFDFTCLVPGHGEVQGDRGYLDKLLAVLTDVRRQVAPLVKQGRTLDEVRKAVDRQALRRPFVADDDGWSRFLIGAVFLEDLIKNAYQEAKGETIVQGGI